MEKELEPVNVETDEPEWASNMFIPGAIWRPKDGEIDINYCGNAMWHAEKMLKKDPGLLFLAIQCNPDIFQKVFRMLFEHLDKEGLIRWRYPVL